MNLGMFFEGTGQGVAGRITNVARLRDLCIEGARQKLHLEPGPGTLHDAHDEASNLWGAFDRVHSLAREDIDVHFVPISY